MEKFATEEQQVEAIKTFWKDNGTAIIIGAVLGLGGLWGWRYYSESQQTAREQASVEYQAAVEAMEADKNTQKLESFIKDTDNAGYKTVAGFVAAQQAVNDGNLDKALSQLKAVATTTQDTHLAAIASLRAARVELEMGNPDDALKTVNGITDKAFNAKVEEVKGDIFVAKQSYDDARMAYTSALESNAGNRLLEMKLDNLSVLAGK